MQPHANGIDVLLFGGATPAGEFFVPQGRPGFDDSRATGGDKREEFFFAVKKILEPPGFPPVGFFRRRDEDVETVAVKFLLWFVGRFNVSDCDIA